MNFKDITIGIVAYNSEKVIYECLNSIRFIKNIIIFDNSNDLNLKKKINRKYPNINFILSKSNLGYGGGNNKIINLCKTKYLFILNPDTILEQNCEQKLLETLNNSEKDISILAPISNDKNYGFFGVKKKFKKEKKFEVDYVKGFAMLINIKIIKEIGKFDENFFLYLEEIDLCRRLRNSNYSIYVDSHAKVKHLGAKSSNLGFEFEKCRNWHWMWSNFYYTKKYNNQLSTLAKYIPQLFLLLIKIAGNLIFFKKKKITKNFFSKSGLFNPFIGIKSCYSPKIFFIK